MKQLLVASEYGEPSNHEEAICQRLFTAKSTKGRDVCLLLITKNLPSCLQILRVVDTLDVPTQVHCTVTGLGNTSIEPHIPSSNLVVEDSIRVIEKYRINPKFVTVRIDPLVPELIKEQMDVIPRILRAFSDIGVKDCRASVVDYYPHVRKRFDVLGMKHPLGFQPSTSIKESMISQLFRLTRRFGMNLHLCAESIPRSLANGDGVDVEGCASSESWRRLGIDNLRPAIEKQRRTCTCDLKKEDLLTGMEKGCKQGCAYCYWR